ncbi:MAG: DNA topoisomerase IV subunit A [Euryarchaeota archaeon]|nr:DNA topoisomerase IV subunit A [Euryarchaeota archaeon]
MSPPKTPRKPASGNGNGKAKKLVGLVELLYSQMEKGEIPSLDVATRTKQNIEYSESSGVWVYGDATSSRSAKTARGALQLLKTTSVVEFLKHQLEVDKSSTLRELYYISENWEDAKFPDQNESDRLIEDLEILVELQREQFHIRSEESGASILGPLEIRERTRRGPKKIHCEDDVGESGYTIPTQVDNIEFLRHDARMVVAIETGGMYDRLVENGFHDDNDAILVHLKGQPSRGTKRLLKRLHGELNLPILVFTDGDPWSYRIFASVAYGSIKGAHLSEYLATPGAKFIGIQPSDIVAYKLPSDKLTDQDIQALKAELTDPRFDTPYWKKEIQLQMDLGRKSEQQSLAKYGLDYVTDTYLPERLQALGALKK